MNERMNDFITNLPFTKKITKKLKQNAERYGVREGSPVGSPVDNVRPWLICGAVHLKMQQSFKFSDVSWPPRSPEGPRSFNPTQLDEPPAVSKTVQ